MIRNFRPFTTPKLDPLQFGNRKGVSTTHLLVKLLYLCHQAADDGNSVRIVFLDYSKAFDRVNHQILLNKLATMDIPLHFLKWFALFLHARSQQVRLGDQFSSIVHMNEAMPQGAMFGMEGFLSLINDLQPSLPLFKYWDDSTTLDIIRKKDPDNNSMQKAIDSISNWTKTNDMQINAQKTLELLISFQKHPPNPPPFK